MLKQYVAIASYDDAGQTAQEALKKVEGIFDTASDSFAGMYQQLLNNDIAVLESSAHTLAILMGVDAETEQKRSEIFELSAPPNRQARNRSGSACPTPHWNFASKSWASTNSNFDGRKSPDLATY